LLRKYLEAGELHAAPGRGPGIPRRTGAEKPNWEALGGDYFLAPWERRTMKPWSGEKGERREFGTAGLEAEQLRDR